MDSNVIARSGTHNKYVHAKLNNGWYFLKNIYYCTVIKTSLTFFLVETYIVVWMQCCTNMPRVVLYLARICRVCSQAEWAVAMDCCQLSNWDGGLQGGDTKTMVCTVFMNSVCYFVVVLIILISLLRIHGGCSNAEWAVVMDCCQLGNWDGGVQS